jgi:phosphate:Na+ symporter
VSVASALTFAGGVGLFLLGMRLMSDGLKVAAGPALRELLARATGSPWRALGSGVLITAMVQSSSAVVFATIGFVNAGLLTLKQAVGVIFGANVGTTLTSWIVAVVGFNVNLQVLAMPAIALGMAGWVGGRGRGVALGQALVGFGIFFLGLDVLKGAFTAADSMLALVGAGSGGILQLLPFVGIGILLTVLMQSSSAALAVTLTAAAGGLMPLEAATAMVIGANVGTTSTAVFATIGATAPARRAAMAHVMFNVVAALAALTAFPLLLGAAVALADLMRFHEQPATILAVFHTMSKLLGVTLIWPFTGQLVAFLERRFHVREDDPAMLQFLDRTVAATPRLAVDALGLELARIGTIAHRMARAALSSEAPDDARLAAERTTVESLSEATIGFTGLVNSGGDRWVDGALPDAVRVVQYYRALAERSVDLARLPPPSSPPPELEAQLRALQQAADQALDAADPTTPGELDRAVIERAAAAFEQVYQQCKAELLRAGSRGALSAAGLVRALDRISVMRRMIDQACKAGRYLGQLTPSGTAAAAVPEPGDATIPN